MGWDQSGRLVIDGAPVDNTNVLDLVHSVTRPRKVAAPAGAGIFLKTLAEINTPTELVPNAKFLKLPAARSKGVPVGSLRSSYPKRAKPQKKTPPHSPPRKRRHSDAYHTPPKSLKDWVGL